MNRLPKITVSLIAMLMIGFHLGYVETYANVPDQNFGIPIQMQTADVTGDGRPDQVVLYGTKKNQDSPYYDTLSVVIQSSSVHHATVIPVRAGGYNPYIKLCDLNGDEITDILVGAETGGSAGTSDYYLFSNKNDQPVELPLPQPLTGSGSYTNNYIVPISIKETGKVYKLNLSDRKVLYGKEGIYKNGLLLKPTDVIVNAFSKLEPIHAVTETQCSLVGLQRISGIYNADTTSYVVSLWKWNSHINKWSLLFSTVEESK